MTWWLWVWFLVEAKFFSGVFLPLTSAEACEKSSQWLWKENMCKYWCEKARKHVCHWPPWIDLSCYNGAKPQYNQPTFTCLAWTWRIGKILALIHTTIFLDIANQIFNMKRGAMKRFLKKKDFLLIHHFLERHLIPHCLLKLYDERDDWLVSWAELQVALSINSLSKQKIFRLFQYGTNCRQHFEVHLKWKISAI